jgi:hypothetical protein
MEDDTNTVVTASLHHLNKDEYRTAIDHLPHRWKSVWTGLVITLRRQHVCEHSISIVLLSYIVLLQ